MCRTRRRSLQATSTYRSIIPSPTKRTRQRRSPAIARVQTVLTTVRGTSSYIANYAVFGENGNGVTSTTSNTPKGAYEAYLETDEGARFSSGSGNENHWSGYHTYLDENTGSKTDSYAVAYMRTFSKGNGFISLDITTAAIQEVLANIDNGKGSYVALFTPDHRVLTMEDGSLVTTDLFEGSDVEDARSQPRRPETAM